MATGDDADVGLALLSEVSRATTLMTRLSGAMSNVRGVPGAATGNRRGTGTEFPNVTDVPVVIGRFTNAPTVGT
jgi:hypothetical protein